MVKNGTCSYMVADYSEMYSYSQEGIVPVPNIASARVLPFGIAVAKGNAILQAAISEILGDLFTRSGPTSPLEDFEL